MTRAQIGLALVLAFQIVLILLIRSPFGADDGLLQTRPFLPEAEGLEPRRVELLGDDEARLTLEREGDDWFVAEADGFPADDSKVETLIADLAELEVRQPVVKSARYHDSFRVDDDDFAGRVQIWGQGDDPQVDLFLGTSTAYQVTPARRAEDDAVYEISGLAAYQVSPDAAAWIDKELVDLNEAALTAVRVEGPAGRVELTRGDTGWVRSDAPEIPLDATSVRQWIDAARTIRLSDPAGRKDEAAHGFDSPLARVTLEHDGSSTTVLIGAQPDDGQAKRYVTRDGYAFSGLVWESGLTPLLEKSAIDLEVGEATPEIEGENPFGAVAG